MNLKTETDSSAATNHIFESQKSSGILVFVVDKCDPVQYRFSKRVKLQVIFDNPFPITNTVICAVDKQNHGDVPDHQHHKIASDTSESSVLCTQDFSKSKTNLPDNDDFIFNTALESDSRKCDLYGSECVRDDSFLKPSQQRVYRDRGKNGIESDEESYDGLQVAFDLTEKDGEKSSSPAIYSRILLRNRYRKKTRQTDQSQNKEMKDFEITNIGTTEYQMAQQQESNKIFKKESAKLKTSYQISRRRRIRNSQTNRLKGLKIREKIRIQNKRKKIESNRTANVNRKIYKKEDFKEENTDELNWEQEGDAIMHDEDENNKKDKANSSAEKTAPEEDEINQDTGCSSKVKRKRNRPKKLLLERNVECKYCGIVFETKLNFFNHRRMEGATHTCEICGKKEPFEALLMVHMQTHKPHKGQFFEDEHDHSEKLMKRRFKMKCDVCGLVVSSLDSLKIHTMTHTGEYPYKCCLCDNQGFFSLSSLHYHLKFHLQSDRFQCKTCNMRFTSRRELGKHQLLTHEIRCGLCGENFPNKTSRNCHFRTVHPDDIQKCNLCWHMFATDADLQKHMLYHNRKGKKEQCPVCGVVVVKLKDHILALHSGNGEEGKIFPCDQCSVRFLTKSKLDKHRLTHTGEKPYACNKCSKKFRDHGMLRKHLVTHTLERRHVCDVCGKRCSLRSNLVMHMRIHSDSRQYSCTFCSQAFNYKSTLNSHIKAKHTTQNQASFNCAHCSQIFHGNAMLASHIVTVHPEVKICEEVKYHQLQPVATSNQQELPITVMEPPSLSTLISDHLPTYRNSMDSNPPAATLRMSNVFDMPGVGTSSILSNLLNRSTSSLINATFTPTPTGYESITQGEMLDYSGRDRNSSLMYQSSAPAMSMPPLAMHLLPLAPTVSIDLEHTHSGNSNIVTPSQSPATNDGFARNSGPLGTKSLQ